MKTRALIAALAGAVIAAGGMSAANAASPGGSVPAAPGTPAAQVYQYGGLYVYWLPPSAIPALTSYRVTVNPGAKTYIANTVAFGNLQSNFTVPAEELVPGTTYSITVAATNSVGTGAESGALSIDYYLAPNPPTSVTVVSGATLGSIDVSWDASVEATGRPISGYVAYADSGNYYVPPATCSTTSATSCTITGLWVGTTYNVYVKAWSQYGQSWVPNEEYKQFTVSSGASKPGAPTGVSATAGNGQATVTWSAPSSNGGASITGYTVTSSPGSKTCTTTGSLSCAVSGLTNGTAYTFTVTATNSAGTGAASSASAAVTPSAPAKPKPKPVIDYVSADGADGFNVQVGMNIGAWSAGNYQWSAYAKLGSTSSDISSEPSDWQAEWTDFAAGDLRLRLSVDPGTYYMVVKSEWKVDGDPYTATSDVYGPFNVCADGAFIAAGAGDCGPTATAPGAPTGVSAVAGDGSATVSWTAPVSDGGAAITGYTVTSSPDSKTCSTTSATSCTVTGLANGTAYTFTVTATNSVGTSDASNASAAVTPTAPATAPGAPSGVSAVAGDGSATVSWTAPDSDGGAAITGYTVTASPGGASCSTTGATSCTVNGLDNFTGYTFTVTATNSVGTSDASDASDVVVPSSGEFQVWLPKPVVARDGDTQVWVFGAAGVDTVKVRIGLEVFEVSPDAAGIAIVDYTMGSSLGFTRIGRVRVTATAVRVAEDGSKERLRASVMMFSPSTTLRKKWREGSQVTVRVRSAGEATALSFRIDGTEVCATDADDRGRASCSFDAPAEGGYTLQTYVGEQLMAENDFSVLAWGRAPQ